MLGGGCECGKVGLGGRGGVSVSVGRWWVYGVRCGCDVGGCGRWFQVMEHVKVEGVGSVQEVSSHTCTLICYIDHPSTVHSIGHIERSVTVSFRPGPMAGLFNTTNKHQYLLCNHKCYALQNASQMLCTTL